MTVVVPTRDRVESLGKTLHGLARQTLPADAWDVIVVDDGSRPAVVLPPIMHGRGTVIRLSGSGRSGARNVGAQAARGAIVAFIDDDLCVNETFLDAHLRAHAEWPGALVVGAIRLPDLVMDTAFGRFRQNLEMTGMPTSRGPVTTRNLCTAANMSIDVRRFVELGGFDPGIASGEDQDFALRHTEGGGAIVFVPQARAVHRDRALDLRSYCRRAEEGSAGVVAFCRRHPDWPENIDRDRVNGPLRWWREPVGLSVRKLAKTVVGTPAVLEATLLAAALFERATPRSRWLDRLYRLALGACIQRGYRRGRKARTDLA